MAFRQQPNLVASGAMGILAGIAIAGGLVFALSLSAAAEQTPAAFEQSTAETAARAKPSPRLVAANIQADDMKLRTYGNSTARARALQINEVKAQPDERGGIVALGEPSPASPQPQG